VKVKGESERGLVEGERGQVEEFSAMDRETKNPPAGAGGFLKERTG